MYFYIGYPRTGTTYLQSLFYRHPEIQYFHKTRRIYYGRQYGDVLKSKLINLEGDESLSTHIYCDVKKKLKRIKEIDGEAKIIISIRRQSEALKSYYHHQVLRDRTIYNFRTFLNTCKGRLFYKSLDYNVTVNECYRLFGRDRVLVCLYDLLVKNKYEYLQKIDLFLGLNESLGKYELNMKRQKVNQSLSQFSINILRFSNLIFSKAFPLLERNRGVKEIIPTLPSLKKQNFLLDSAGYEGCGRYHRIMYKFLFHMDAMVLPLISGKIKQKFSDAISPEMETIMSNFRESNALLSELIGVNLLNLWY